MWKKRVQLYISSPIMFKFSKIFFKFFFADLIKDKAGEKKIGIFLSAVSRSSYATFIDGND